MTDQLDRLASALADRYAVERELGSGGMATVYLARDLKHDRLVAIKVLHPDLAASLGAERFLREIRVTAKLSHPHILPLYDSGEADGLLYYVMPFVEGESLAGKLGREKQLSLKEAVQITREVAEALAHAHSYGLVHRDIKPDNIMMSGGHAIVADFGIATAVSEAGGEKLTQTGMAIGTPAYMSPEQALGEEVDARSDVYSLGCMLYEMLIGQIPFTGATPQQIIARHSMDHIPQPSMMRDTIPEDLEEVVFRSMAKLPADRYRTAFEMAEALAEVDTSTTTTRRAPVARRPRPRRGRPAWLVPAGVALGISLLVALGAWAQFMARRVRRPLAAGGLDPRHIAVLYFDDLGRGDTLGYLADGLTEALIEDLSHVQALDVISRNGVAPYRGSSLPLDSIARALQVGSLIRGSVEPLEGNIRVTVRLVDGTSGADFNRTTFQLPAAQLLTVRDSVAREVSSLLRTRLGEEVRLRQALADTKSVEAWSLDQRAERLRKDAVDTERTSAKAADATFQRADSVLQLAQRADPKWAEPVYLQGEVAYQRSVLYDDKYQQRPWLEQAIAHADDALRLAPGYPRALSLRGVVRQRIYNLELVADPQQQAALLDSAEADLKAATAGDPTQARAWLALTLIDYAKNDNVTALLNAQRAYEADAYLRNQNVNLYQLFWTNYDLEQFPEAQRWCREGYRRFPTDWRFSACRLWMLTTPWVQQPDPAKAWALAAAMDTLSPPAQRPFNAHLARIVVGGVLGRAGLADSARHVLVAARAGGEVDPERDLVGYEAVMRVMLGDDQEAITLLKQYVVSNPTHLFTSGRNLHWWWRPLRDLPDFQAVTSQHR